MAWQPSKPGPNDVLAQSQSDLQGNFTAINTMLNPTTGTITLPVQGAAQAANANLNLVNIFNGSGNFATARNEIFFVATVGDAAPRNSPFPITASNFMANGFTYLPSGIILQWGSAATPSGNANPAGPAINFPFPFPNRCLNVVITSSITSSNRAVVQFAGLTPDNVTGFYTYTWLNNGDVPGNCTFLAMGY